MKLIELHVRNATARTPGHGDTIAGSAIIIAGIKVGFGCPPRCQNDNRCLKSTYSASGLIENIGADTTISGKSQLATCNQVNSDMMFVNIDAIVGQCVADQNFMYCTACGISCMYDSAV